MEKEEQRIIDMIVEDIQQQSNLVLKALDDEIFSMHTEQLNFFKEGLKKETDVFLEKELSDLRSYAATKASQEKFNAKRKLLELRADLIQQLMDDVMKNVKAFIDSDGYVEYIRRSLRNVPISKDGYFVVSDKDKEMFIALLKEMNAENEVRTAYIEVGGFYYVDEVQKIEFDCTFAERIEEAKEWFRVHSGFTVAESGDEHE